jgi:hypothetical protein
LDLVFAIGLARRVLVILLLFASDALAVPLEELSKRSLAGRIERPYVAIALVLVSVIYVYLEPRMGVAAAAAVILMGSGPTAALLEKLSSVSPERRD